MEPLSPSPSPAAAGGKRKRDDDSKQSKRARRRKNKTPKNIDEGDLDEEKGMNVAIGRMDSRLLADYMAQRTKRYEPDLSLVELEERYIPERAIRDTSIWEQERSLPNLPTYLETFAQEDVKKVPKKAGHPHTIVVAGAGIRAADLTRSLRKFETKDVKVAKLFAKHIKLKEAMESCKRMKMNIGVGTPQRIIDLLDGGALSTDNLKRIVVDASYIDDKKRGVMDMKDTQPPLAKLLTREDLKARYGKDKKIELLFY
ncbi:uncharacterized protein K452DRAFT_219405 [Aplosporella prunicola CBS 121167]|uniref:Uncharacterized protein n=1 Tax=Aplosporella prunicola CBS 121167 TaxID=1176127 RepID=A0A6A6BSH2_9PEZI|nr:uncharacterized protein K452DRAFT_219405 [Aplosporella prunicola CBS 121167]KAF2146235.1 hypothetical protein K452DRAFT_219405 [Aplosporella prunicola CBS 121167]